MHPPSWPVVLAMLASRTVLFAAFQALAALGLRAAGAADPWEASAAWWPLTAAATNLVVVAALVVALRREGESYLDLFRLRRETAVRDLLATLALLVVAGVFAALPNLGLSALLWGDPAAGNALFLRPLPAWAAVAALVAFPATIALAELPLYGGYALPRVRALAGRTWVAVGTAGLALALQHATLPLLLDARFFAWRALMFLPFALVVMGALAWRPRLLPYLAAAHGLLDLAAAWQVYALSA